jgi:hypothetical protein
MGDKILTRQEKNRRMFLSMYKSLENKMVGRNLIWWESLTIKQKYSLVHKWHDYKKSVYPKSPKIKNFLEIQKPKYKVQISVMREVVIDKILS